MPITAKGKFLFLFLVPCLLYVATLHIMPLLDPDETRYSELADNMLDTGDYVTPHLNHVVYLEKPPLETWVTAIFFKLFGENEFSTRLFPALCAWGCILLTFTVASFLYDEKTGLYSAGVLSTLLYLFVLGRMAILDIPLAFFVCLATWAGYRYLVGSRPVRTWRYAMYAACALAFLTKGLIGIVFPFAILFFWLLFTKRGRDIVKLFSPVGLLILCTIITPWIFLAQKANHDFLWFFFIHEHILRYATKIHGRYQSFFFYVPIVILGTLPWLASLIQAIRARCTGVYDVTWGKANLSFLVIWSVFVFIFFSISSSKLIPYIAPIFLPISIMLGHLFRGYDEQTWRPMRGSKDKFYYYLPVAIQSLLFIALLLTPCFMKDHTELGGDLIISSPRNWWGLILLPVATQCLMVFLPGMIKRRFNTGWFLTVYLLSALFLISLVFPASAFLAPYKSSYSLSKAIQIYLPAGEGIYQYKTFLYGIESYTDIRTSVVDSFGEMGFGMEKLPAIERAKYFLSQQDFFRLVREKRGSVYCIAVKKGSLNELKQEFPRLKVIWSNGVQHFIRLPY